ncbi:MAG: TonB-dependent receptor [Bacteroidetes bacterium]|nr:TonB-dependent receptor [Bacteroidota bacterium]
MRSIPRGWIFDKLFRFFYLALVAVSFNVDGVARAQEISVNFVAEPLSEALKAFSEAQRIDLVYTQSRVQRNTTTCRYRGDDLSAALTCILSGQNLKAVRLRRRQYVLVEVEQPGLPNSTIGDLGTLHGFVSDAQSKETLPGAHVYLPRLSIGAATNDAGYYAIPSLSIGEYRAKISFLGYATLDTLLQVSEQSTVVRLNRRILESQILIVSSERREPYEVEPGVRHIPVDRISKLPGFPGEADLLQSLRWLPSVQRVRTNQGGLIVRGGEPDQILYLIDGAPVYHMWHIGGLLSIYQPEAFKDVRLYRGSFPAEHGGRLSAVLDAEFKDGTLDRVTGMAGIGLLSARVFVEGPLNDKISFMVSGRRSYIDRITGRRHPVDDGIMQDTMRTGIYLYDLSAKLAWRPSTKQRVTLGVYGSADILDIRLPANLSLANASSSLLPLRNWLRPSNLIFEIDTRWSNRLISARYHYLHSDQIFLTLTAYGTSYRAHERIFIRPTAISSVNSMYGVDILDVGAKLDVDYYFSFSHHIRAGISVIQRGFSSDLDALILQTNAISESTDERSTMDNTEIIIYAQDTWKPTRRLQIQPGVRFSQLRGSNGLRVSPRLGIRYDMDKVIVRMASGINVQYLHQVRDRYSVLYDLISYRWIPASRSVAPSYSYHLSFGGSLLLGTSFTADIDLYAQLTYGLLLPRNEQQSKDGLAGPGIEVGAILGQYTRGRALAHGVEVNLQYDRGSSIIWMSYAAGRSRSRAPELGETQLRPGRYDVPQRLQIALQRSTRHWMYGISGKWRSGYPITVPEARYAVGDPLSENIEGLLYFPKINNGRLPPHINYGLQGAYRFGVGAVAVQVKLDINNLTFRRNVIDREFDPSIPEHVVITSRYGFPAYPLLELTARF